MATKTKKLRPRRVWLLKGNPGTSQRDEYTDFKYRAYGHQSLGGRNSTLSGMWYPGRDLEKAEMRRVLRRAYAWALKRSEAGRGTLTYLYTQLMPAMRRVLRVK